MLIFTNLAVHSVLQHSKGIIFMLLYALDYVPIVFVLKNLFFYVVIRRLQNIISI